MREKLRATPVYEDMANQPYFGQAQHQMRRAAALPLSAFCGRMAGA